MKSKKLNISNSFLKFAALLLIFLNLLLGGIANSYIYELTGFISFTILFLIVLNKKQKISFPTGSVIFAFFISFQLISFIWTKNIFNSIEYILLFVSSFFLYLFFYNFKEIKLKSIETLIILLGIVFGMLFIFTQIIPIPFLIKLLPQTYYSLYSPYSDNHNLIGDYWSIITIIAIYRFINKKSLKNIFLISLSLVFIVLSQSRSAFLGILIPTYLLLHNQILSTTTKKYIQIFIYLVFGIFIFSSIGKTTIFARPYYIQGIFALVKKPFGVGMGNFRSFTNNVKFGLTFIPNSSAAKTHNIFLEIFSGIGIFGVSFILWLIVSLKKVIRNIEKVNFLYLLIFVAISVNFFFNVTYAIPTMLWIWFSILGIILSESVKN